MNFKVASGLAGELRRRNPIAALDKRGGFIRVSCRQPLLLVACGPQQDWAQRCGRESGDDRELVLDFAAQLVNLLTYSSIDLLEFSLHHPQRRIVSAAELLHLPREPLTDAWVRVVLVALPALEHGLAHALKTRSIALRIAPERQIQEPLGILARDCAMPEVEFVLPMDIGEVNVRQQPTLSGHFLIKWRPRNRRVKHELMKVGLVTDRGFNFLDDVVWRVVLEPNDRRALHSYAMFAKLSRELPNVSTLQLAISGLGRFQAHPYPGNAEFDQFLRGVFSNRIGGGKDGKL